MRNLLATWGWVLAVLAGAVGQNVRITEVMANPNAAQGGQKAGEFVELFNLGDEPVDLAGWKIADRDAVDDLIPFFEEESTVLAPHAFAVILDPDFTDGYTIPPETLLLRPKNSAIGNGLSVKDPVRLIDPEGRVVDTFTPSTSARSGVSFERIDFSGPDVPENWQLSYAREGHTLGRPSSQREDAQQPDLPDLGPRYLVINEILFRPAPDAPEWVELYNPQPVDVPLFGWTIADSRDRPVPLPPMTLPAGGYLILTRDAAEFRTAYGNAPPETLVAEVALPTLNNNGDRVILRGPTGEIVDSVEYGAVEVEEGQSLERRNPEWESDRLDNWLPAVDLSLSTPGAENSVAHETGERPVLIASPNPFDPAEGPTELRFEAPLTARISVRIFDSAGTLIRVLMDDEPHGGRQTLHWDGTDDAGKQVAPGVYIAQLLAVVDEKPKATAIAVVVAQR